MKLGEIVQPSYYEGLWSRGQSLKDPGLMWIAFENYVHTMLRDRKPLTFKWREYNSDKKSYDTVGLRVASSTRRGVTVEECERAMRALPDPLAPSSRVPPKRPAGQERSGTSRTDTQRTAHLQPSTACASCFSVIDEWRRCCRSPRRQAMTSLPPNLTTTRHCSRMHTTWRWYPTRPRAMHSA